MENHPYVGLEATGFAFNTLTVTYPEIKGVIVAIGQRQESTDLMVWLLLPDGGHKVRPLHTIKVNAAEAGARLARL